MSHIAGAQAEIVCCKYLKLSKIQYRWNENQGKRKIKLNHLTAASNNKPAQPGIHTSSGLYLSTIKLKSFGCKQTT